MRTRISGTAMLFANASDAMPRRSAARKVMLAGSLLRAGFAGLALILALGGCGTPVPGTDAATPGVSVGPIDAEQWPAEPCSQIDQLWYPTSRDLENAADVMVVGEITSIELVTDDEAGPQWNVGFRGESSWGDSAEQAMGENTIRFPRICGDAPYSKVFGVGGRFILLLRGPIGGDHVFSLVSTTQAVIPIIDGYATPLPDAYRDGVATTIAYSTAAGFGAPLIDAPTPGGDFTAGPIFEGISDSVVPQFWNANVGAAWSPDPGVLWVFTAGSTGCPLYASSPAEEVGNNEIQIILSTQLDPEATCNADLVWSTTEVSVPLGTREDEPLSVHFQPDGSQMSGEPRTIVVPPRAVLGDEIQLGVPGEAAWADPVIAHQQLDADSLEPQAGGWARGIPSSITAPTDAPSPVFIAAWAPTLENGPNLLYVITWGSGSCPVLAEPQATLDQGDVIVTVRSRAASAACTRDFTPTTSIVAVPDGVDPSQPTTVRLGDLGTYVVSPPRITE